MKWFCLVVLGFFLVANVFARDRSNEHVRLMSYPRSGNHWTMYIIEYFCQRTDLYERPVTGDHTYVGVPLYQESLFEEEDLQRNIIKVHCPKNNSKFPMIFILRNFKEVLARHLCDPAEKPENICNRIKLAITNRDYYFSNIKVFDEMDPEERLLVYYEDLLDFPAREITRIVTFLSGECDSSRVKEFCLNLEEHQRRGLRHYQYNKPVSYLADHRRHTHQLSVESLRKLDRMVEEMYPELWDKYLSRYAD